VYVYLLCLNIFFPSFLRVEFLEKQSIVNIERFKQRSKDLKTSVQKELEVATLDSAGRFLVLRSPRLKFSRAYFHFYR
jgi:hypothetical protein